jgi:hypothetical protein
MALADEAELERELDRLYGLDLDEFTRARDELARRARAEGQRAIAARVKELRKPTLPAWIVNQLARRHELDVRRLLRAGERLAAAQARAAGEGGREEFLEARREERRALERLAEDARELLAAAGRARSSADRVQSTLRAAAATAEGRQLLERGRLTEELQPPGFEALAGLEPAGKRPRRPKPPPRRHADEARKRVRELRTELRALERRAREAERRAELARRELESAEAGTEAIGRELREAEGRLEEAERELAELTARR